MIKANKYLRYTKSVYTALALIICSGTVIAQTKYALEWDSKPVIQKVHDKFLTESGVVLMDSRLYEFEDDPKSGVFLSVTNHKLIRINDDKGIELFNKGYISISEGSELVYLKARTISPGGRVIDLAPSKILDAVEEGHVYKKFAYEGVEKGSEVEYVYKLKKKPSFFGIDYFQSAAAPTQRAEFMLVVPARLVFDVKGYHNFSVGKDTVVNEKRIIIATEDDIPALDEEKYAINSPNTENVQYKLSYNNSKDKNVRVYTWNELAKNVYSSYTTFTEKEEKAAQNFLREINIPSGGSEAEKIILIEEYIKDNINTSADISGNDAVLIDKIVKTKNADNEGTCRLYTVLFAKLNIPYQIVYPSKRDELPLDPDFENFRLVDEMLFFFPGTGKFLSPSNKIARYPFIDPYWAATTGLFLKGTSIGNFKTAIPSFDSIPIEPYEKNYINLEAVLKINSTGDTALLHARQTWLGYAAMSYRPAYAFLAKDKIDNFNKDVVKGLLKSDDVEHIVVENSSMTDFSKNQPLAITADIKSAQLIEKAGNKLLVKVGEIIGPQVEMYQEKPRRLPIVLEYPHALDRHFTLIIPEGYQAKNLKDLNFNIVSKTNDLETMGFVSGYTLSNNVVTVTVHEFYKQLSYPVSQFEEFKKIINASADFNKVTIVLEKK